MTHEQAEMPNDDEPLQGPSSPWPRRIDQLSMALMMAIGLLGTVVWWWTHGGPSGELVEFERLKPQRAEYQVDVNQADWPELAPLPYIGETLARRIVESRKHDGPFRNHKDLCRVKGIGPRRLEQLRPYLLPIDINQDMRLTQETQ